MNTVHVYDTAQKRILVTRDSARVLASAVTQAFRGENGERRELIVDFAGVGGVSPSFVDELLALIDETARSVGVAKYRVRFLSPPTRISQKFDLVARGRGLVVEELVDGSWMMSS